MARSVAKSVTTKTTPACYKFLSLAIPLALLLAGGQTTWAQVSGSASVNADAGGISGAISGSSATGAGAAGVSASLGSGAGASGGAAVATGASESNAGSGGASVAAAASASVSTQTTTPHPEGLLSKMKEIVKSSVSSLTGESESKKNSMEVSGNASSGGSSSLGSGTASASAAASASAGHSTGEGIVEKIKDKAQEVKDEVKTLVAKPIEGAVSGSASSSSGSGSSSSSGITTSGDVRVGGSQVKAQVQVGTGKGDASANSEGVISKMLHKVEDKASEFGQKLAKPLEGSSVSASAAGSAGGVGVKAQAKVKIGGFQVGGKVQMGGGGGQSSQAKGVTVDVLDKAHEVIKKPLEKVLKPLEETLGVKDDPLLKAFDTSHDLLMQPVSLLSKPVEAVFNNAFKTSDEARRESERLMDEQELRATRRREERARKEGRSILGEITDRTVELAEKPFEIILKPVDRALGLDKNGAKNPLLMLIDEIYNLSKKPLDTIAKPFENILKKMAEGEQEYQVQLRLVGDSTAADPKLFTRLADGALNIADRVITKPIDLAMRPLGYNEHGAFRNPIVEAAHQLKNATRVGLELFTKPIDRIIKEIAEIGAIKNEREREARMERKRQEASRIVRAMDKLNELAQTPWEIVLRPVGRALGFSKEGQKEPLLRAWDVVHSVVRTPIQVFSKPIEDAFLGEQRRGGQRFNAQAELRLGNKSLKFGAHAGAAAAASSGGGASAAAASASAGSGAGASFSSSVEDRKNLFIEGIKKVEKFAVKPLEVITSPIRRLILGEDARRSAKARASINIGGIQAKAQVGAGGRGDEPDKIVQTIKQMNNVVLKPLEVITQPISDIINPESKQQPRKVDVKVQAHASQQSGGSQSSAQAQVKAKI